MKVAAIFFTMLFIQVFSTATNATDSSWQLELESPQYKLYTQNKAGSEFLQTKAVLTIPTSSEKVLKHFGTGDKCWSWQRRCEKTKVIKSLSKSEQVIYVAIDMPWPISNREFLVRSHSYKSADENAFIIKLTPEHEVKYKEDYVQGSVNSEYIITRLKADETQVMIVMHTEFAGSVSGSLINSKLINELEADVKTLIQLSRKTN
jgi:hypothetical protein